MEMVVIGFQAARKGTERYYVMKEVHNLDDYTKNTVGLADTQVNRRSVKDIKRSLKAAKHFNFQSGSSVNVTQVSSVVGPNGVAAGSIEIPPEYYNQPLNFV